MVNSPEFLRTVALLFEAPAYCILLLGIFDFGQEQLNVFERELAFGAVAPVLLTKKEMPIESKKMAGIVNP